MRERRTYLYRLNVQYPPGSDDMYWEPSGWRDDPARWGIDPDTGAHEPMPFSWPTIRTYISQSAAKSRADLLRSYGAVVEVERSAAVEWPARQIGEAP